MVEVKVVVTAEMKMNTTHPVEKCVRNIATSIHIQLSSLWKTDYQSSLRFTKQHLYFSTHMYEMSCDRSICVAVVVRAAWQHVRHVNWALIAKTKLGVVLVIFCKRGRPKLIFCKKIVNVFTIITIFITIITIIIIIITGAPSQSQRALQQTLAGKVIVGEGHHS